MTSPVEVTINGAKSGWFDSLKRMRKVKSTDQGHLQPLDQQRMTGSKSMSSLHAVVNHSVQALGRIEQQDQSTDSLNTILSSKDSRRSVSPKPSWRSKFSSSRNTNRIGKTQGKPPLPDPISSTPKQPKQRADTASHFFTLPRKKPGPMNQSEYNGPKSNSPGPDALPDPSPSSRSRSYSTATLDRRSNKRTTVWYTYSETDVRVNFKSRVSFSRNQTLFPCACECLPCVLMRHLSLSFDRAARHSISLLFVAFFISTQSLIHYGSDEIDNASLNTISFGLNFN